jgi:hypothetical protein
MRSKFLISAALPLLFFFCIWFIQSQPNYASSQISTGEFKSKMKEYSIGSGNVTITTDPSIGGRITSFKLGAYDFIVGKDVSPEGYGSTFWPSPQSSWNWPPPAILDNQPYSIEYSSDKIQMVSGEDSITGFQFRKEFSISKRGVVNLKYSIINVTEKPKKVAPWEITRVRKGGLLFFPIGIGKVKGKNFIPAPTVVLNGIVWYQDGTERPKENELSIADGSEGWAAYVIDGKVFIKVFPDVKPADQAPGEAEVLFYVDAKADFIEFEIEGKYRVVEPRQELSWNVRWLAATVPLDIKIEKGNKELVEFVRAMVESEKF